MSRFHASFVNELQKGDVVQVHFLLLYHFLFSVATAIAFVGQKVIFYDLKISALYSIFLPFGFNH